MSSSNGLDYWPDNQCFECETGIYRLVRKEYKIELNNGEIIVIPNFPLLECTDCGDGLIGHEQSVILDRAIEERFPGYFKRGKKDS